MAEGLKKLKVSVEVWGVTCECYVRLGLPNAAKGRVKVSERLG